ncbi:MAG: hypothetical protein Ct9H300mP1_38580 [Planctomycetaceae bacterium]|nr:MAG: hypothetical protein Ct9H300mP1_38580 [Planctomycetaceae bacterium]
MRADGFSNTAYNLGVDLKHIEAYAKLAAITVERMNVLKFTARFSRSRKLSTDDTMDNGSRRWASGCYAVRSRNEK